MWFILTLILLLAIVFGAITTLPLVLIMLLCLAVVFKRSWIFALAFFTGLFLDIFLVRPLGESSIFFLFFILMLFLYEKKFEIQTMHFVFLSSFFGTLFYLLIFGYNHVFAQALISSLMAVLLFKALSAKRKVQSEKLQLKA
jgi:hypothetical protein